MDCTFGALLRGHRMARSLTQEQLAERARLSPKAISALERGERRRPYPHTVAALADALGLDAAERAVLVRSVPHPAATGPDAAHGSPAPHTGCLPAPAGSVIGRGDQRAVVAALLTSAHQRMVTLTGPGGVGKTTLALVAAADAGVAFPGGVVMVELASVAQADAVVPAIATELGLPGANIDTADALVPYVRGRRLLLLLDNLEHVLECGPQLATLVVGCRDLVVLATSRAPLRVRAELEVRVAPLDPTSAVQMFQERALAAGAVLGGGHRTTSAVAALCERADGLPLALELAASAAALLGPAALLERLDVIPMSGPQDLPHRQRSMAATLGWSLDLLPADARLLLARLSVCRGAFSLAAAEEVGGADPSVVLPALTDLVRHALVNRVDDVEGTERFRLLEPVRQFAADLLEPGERDEARCALARAVLATARALHDDLRGSGQVSALRLLDADFGNVRVTVDHLLDHGAADEAAELLWCLALHLMIRGHSREGRLWAERIHAFPMSDLARARLLVAWAGLLLLTDPQDAHRVSQEGVAVARHAGNDDLAADALLLAAASALFVADESTTQRLSDEALQAARTDGDPWRVTQALLAVAQSAAAERPSEAARTLRAAEASARRTGLSFETGAILTTRAILAERQKDYATAAALLAEAVGLAATIRNSWTLPYILSALAGVAVQLGEFEAGARLFGAWASYAAEHAVVADHPVTLDLVQRDLSEARSGLGKIAFEAEFRIGREATMNDVVELAQAIECRAGGRAPTTRQNSRCGLPLVAPTPPSTRS
ncbi:ATP-binding protein [Pseudonocardia xinjiangensis]|uniref:ATP-binding protein n=1 Tax=Pseudonocardia xinjiangensis TaxID=75289 RepID=UPI003D8BFB32